MTDEVQEDFNTVRASLIKDYPFIFSFLEYTKVVYCSNMDDLCRIDKNVLYLGRDVFTNRLNDIQFILLHAALHIAFMDADRYLYTIGDKENPRLSNRVWNLACDIVNNKILAENDITFSGERRYADYGMPDECKTKEQIYSYLYAIYKNLPPDEHHVDLTKMGEDLTPPDEQPGTSEHDAGSTKTLYCGSNCVDASNMLNREYEDMIKTAVADSYMSAKNMGSVSNGLDRLINALLDSKINWKVLVQRRVKSYMAKFRRCTYMIRSRKHPLLPGYQSYSVPDIRILVDTSGSISELELTTFISEIYALGRRFGSKIYVYPFDAISFKRIDIVRKNDFGKLITELKGGGGTVIGSTLQKVIKEGGRNDLYILFSDCDISDANSPDVIANIHRVRPIVATTQNVPRSWKVRSIQV